MKIKTYGDAASEYKTCERDSKGVNNEFSSIMQTMRTGLQNYKTTLGTQKKAQKPQNSHVGLKKTD
jgi:hypothetical protein